MKRVGVECFAGFRAHERPIHLTLTGNWPTGCGSCVSIYHLKRFPTSRGRSKVH